MQRIIITCFLASLIQTNYLNCTACRFELVCGLPDSRAKDIDYRWPIKEEEVNRVLQANEEQLPGILTDLLPEEDRGLLRGYLPITMNYHDGTLNVQYLPGYELKLLRSWTSEKGSHNNEFEILYPGLRSSAKLRLETESRLEFVEGERYEYDTILGSIGNAFNYYFEINNLPVQCFNREFDQSRPTYRNAIEDRNYLFRFLDRFKLAEQLRCYPAPEDTFTLLNGLIYRMHRFDSAEFMQIDQYIYSFTYRSQIWTDKPLLTVAELVIELQTVDTPVYIAQGLLARGTPSSFSSLSVVRYATFNNNKLRLLSFKVGPYTFNLRRKLMEAYSLSQCIDVLLEQPKLLGQTGSITETSLLDHYQNQVDLVCNSDECGFNLYPPRV